MTEKTAFDDGECFQLWKAPLTASLAVIAAQPGGLFAEMAASVKFVVEARQTFTTELLQAVLAPDQEKAAAYTDRFSTDLRQMGQLDASAMLGLAVTDIRRALAVLRLKAEAEEIQEYKQMILQRAEKVAQAGKEGSFLGIGGVRVSEAEEQALAEIRLAVNRLN